LIFKDYHPKSGRFQSLEEVNVIRGHHVVEHTQAITLLCLEKPLEITAAVPGKLEQEFLFMAAVRNMPNITRYVMSIRPWHSNPPCLEGLLGWQKHRSKILRDAHFSVLSHDFDQLPWSDPSQQDGCWAE
jgi:hypothetical protein